MIKAKVYNQEGNEMNTLELNESVFGIKVKPEVVHQVFVGQMANKREPWADTKGKGEVRGGGRKPWKQKGTGRARHGSIRSPLWRGGGITFGPLSVRNYKQKINKKMNKLAVEMCLSDRVANDRLFVVENLPTDHKTKTYSLFFNKLPSKGKNTLVLINKTDENIKRAVSNLPKICLTRIQDLNVKDILNSQYLLITKEALAKLEKRLA